MLIFPLEISMNFFFIFSPIQDGMFSFMSSFVSSVGTDIWLKFIYDNVEYKMKNLKNTTI